MVEDGEGRRRGPDRNEKGGDFIEYKLGR